MYKSVSHACTETGPSYLQVTICSGNLHPIYISPVAEHMTITMLHLFQPPTPHLARLPGACVKQCAAWLSVSYTGDLCCIGWSQRAYRLASSLTAAIACCHDLLYSYNKYRHFTLMLLYGGYIYQYTELNS